LATRYITELRVSSGAEDELARHGLSLDDALDVLWESPKFFRNKVPGRDKMIGRSYSGQLLTIIIEAVPDVPDTYDVITGWKSSKAERTAWEQAK
jgi:uncharacterized DUF497 family protein